MHSVVAQEGACIRPGSLGLHCSNEDAVAVNAHCYRCIHPVAVGNPAADRVAGDVVDITDVVRHEARAIHSRGTARKLGRAGLESDMERMNRPIAQRGRSGYGKTVNSVVAKERSNIGPRVAGRYHPDQCVAVVYLDVNWSIKAVPVSSPSTDRVASRVVQESDIVWRQACAAVDRSRAAGKLGCATLELDVDGMRGAVLERGRTRNAE